MSNDNGKYYSVILTSKNRTILNVGDTDKKQFNNKNPNSSLNGIINILKIWFNQYGILNVGSSNLNKTKSYYNLLSKHFNCSKIEMEEMNLDNTYPEIFHNWKQYTFNIMNLKINK